MSIPRQTNRGPYQNGVRRRREIIDSASRIFASYGYNGGSLRQIAAEVGVSPAALTRHFESKEGLLTAVLQAWDEEVDARGSKQQGLAYFISLPATVADNKRNRGIIELFLTLTAESTNSAHPAHDFIKNRYNRVVDSAARQLREARDEGQTRAMEDTEIEWQIRTLYSMMDGIQLQWLIDPELDSVPIFTHALNAILRDWTGRDNVALSADQTADPACAVQPVMAD